jgi:hypothetical protein
MTNFGWRFLSHSLGQLKSSRLLQTLGPAYMQEVLSQELGQHVSHLPLLHPQPGFALPGPSTSLSNEINITESAVPLIWTALVDYSPGRQSWVCAARVEKSR